MPTDPSDSRTERRAQDGWSRFPPSGRLFGLLAYSIVAGIACFWRLGAAGIIHMEGMVADGGRRMLASGEWLVPRVYGEIYTFKPALAYWLAAAAHWLADPPPEWLLRLPFAGAVFGMGLVVFGLMDKLAGSRVATCSSIAAVSGAIVLEKVKLAEFDGLLTAGVGVATIAACYNLTARKPSLGIWFLAYLGLAAGFLAKGIPALMFYAPGLLAAAWWSGRLTRLIQATHLAACLLFLGLAGTYLAGVYRVGGAAAFEQPVQESAVRGLGWFTDAEEDPLAEFSVARLSEDERSVVENPWTALGQTAAKPLLIAAAFLPWSLLAPFAFGHAGRSAEELAIRSILARAAGGFCIAGILVFMAVPTHSMRYYMPLSAGVAILAGLGLPAARASRAEVSKALWIGIVGATWVVGLLALTGAAILETPPLSAGDRLSLGIAGAAAVALAAAIGRTRRPGALAALMITVALCATAIDRHGVGVMREHKRNLESVAQAFEPHLPPGEPVWVLGPSDRAGKVSSLFFYLQRPVLAFRPFGEHPPPGSHCILTTDRMVGLENPPGFEFIQIVRVEGIWRDYLLGRCSWTQGAATTTAVGTSTPEQVERGGSE